MKRIHFIGIGGIGMSAIARILNRQGHSVTGSDEKESSIIIDMQREGIRCFIGHSEENLGDCDIVVYSSSINEENIELREAHKRHLRVMHRADMLSKMLEDKKGIAVTGTHGKTTTTAVLALIFEKAGLKPTAAIGGEVLNFQSNALYGGGDYFIFEADESDGSFLKFYPDSAVLLNIDKEHFDYFKNIENTINIYGRFIGNIKKTGTAYYNADDKNLSSLFNKHRGKKMSFGTGGDAKIKAVDIRQDGLNMRFKCVVNDEAATDLSREVPSGARGATCGERSRSKSREGSLVGATEELVFPMPGRHNITNALAAIAVARDAGIDFSVIKDALACYKGTKRRFEIKNTSNGIMVVEDYAHHPTEIEAVLRACIPLKKNPIVVFQPHRYTRTKDLFNEFIGCFKLAKHTILTDIYAASEEAIEGWTAERLFREMKRSGIENVEHLKKKAVTRRVMDLAGKDDMVLILGAGDINDVAKELV